MIHGVGAAAQNASIVPNEIIDERHEQYGLPADYLLCGITHMKK